MTAELESRSTTLKIVEAGSIILLNILSLLGNILVCLSVYRNSRLRTTTNLYIIALAVSDLIAAIFAMPLIAGVLISSRWPFGETACQMHAYFSLFVVYVSPVTMGLTAVNRYVRICKSNEQYERFFSKTKSRIVLGSAWAFVICYILITSLTGLQGFHFVSGYAACLNKHLSKFGLMLHYFVVVGLFFLLPLAATIFSYIKVAKKIRDHTMEIAQRLHTQGRNTSISVNEIRLSRSLFVVVFPFMLCWMPAWVITILSRFLARGSIARNVQLLCAFCLSLSNTINPFIYAGMNPLFRREFRRLLGCKFGERIEESQHTPNKGQNTISSMAQSDTVAGRRTAEVESFECRQINEQENKTMGSMS